jgi:hypothetical protein
MSRNGWSSSRRPFTITIAPSRWTTKRRESPRGAARKVGASKLPSRSSRTGRRAALPFASVFWSG